jgi:xylulokinase
MRQYYLGLDIGTSGLKTVMIDQNGKILTVNTHEYPCHSPKPLWSEQEPADWWQATIKGIKKALAETKIDPKSIGGVGLSGQMHGAVFLADTVKPLRRAILWNDQRTQKQCEEIEKIVGGRKKLIRMVANPALTGYTAPKILWLRENEPQNFKKIKHILLPKDYIRLLLTGEYATEVSDASGTLLFDVQNRRWHEGLIHQLGLKPEWFPKCYESPEITGYINKEAAHATGLPVGTPVVGGGGDQACGAVGSGIVGAGIVSATLGTSGVVFAYSDSPTYDPQGRVQTMCHAVPGKWCVFGCMLSAGGSFQWFKNQLGCAEKREADEKGKNVYDLLVAEAAKAPAGSEGLFFLPYLTGERCPYPDPNARGCFIGLTVRHTRPAIIRSVLEGITFGMRDQVEIMREMGVKINQVRASGGGANSSLWRQIQADMYQAKIVRVNVAEGAALGAAILAAVGTGAYDSVPEACRKIIKAIDEIKPVKQSIRCYNNYYKIYRNLYGDLKETFADISRLS